MTSIGDVILNIGKSKFYSTLFDFLRTDMPLSQLIVHRYRASQVDVLAVEVSNGSPSANPFIELYRGSYLHRDPLRHEFVPSSTQDHCVRVVNSRDITDREYRSRLFDQAGIGSKMSIIERMRDQVFSISLYRSAEAGTFSGHDLSFALRQQETLSAVLRRHTMHEERPDPDSQSLTGILLALPLARPLSEREASICALVALGHSSEAIGLLLDLSIHSVTTYRRRAYEKLAITSQNELFALLLKATAS